MSCLKSAGLYSFTYSLASDTISLVYDDYIQVGDTYYSDGSWGKGYYEGKTPIGIVFRTYVDGVDNELDSPTNYGWSPDRHIRGYVVALNEASELRGWWCAPPHKLYTKAEKTAETSPYSGYINTDIIKNNKNNNGSGTLYNNSDVTQPKVGMWAFKVAVDYQLIAPAPSYPATSEWYLPSIRQVIDLVFFNRLRFYLQEEGGTALVDATEGVYWSSTEYAQNQAWSYNLSTGNTSIYQKNGNVLRYVRPVLTF